MKLLKILSIALLTTVISACTSTQVSKPKELHKIYNEDPKSILVVPAINNTTAPESSDFITTTLAQPLSFSGYYIAPLELVQTIFQQEGILDGSQLLSVDPTVYGQQFGVDSVMFVSINKWETNYVVIGGSVEVALKYELFSTKTGAKLWEFEDSLEIETTSSNNGSLIANLVVTAINTATTDYVPIATKINYMALKTVPVGHYHNKYPLKSSLAPATDAKSP
jgi:hypothetical protein